MATDLFLRVALIVLYMHFCCLSSAEPFENCDAFTVQPQDVVAMAGQVAMMRCNYTGRYVEWDKDGTSILHMQEPCNCQVSEDGTLHFNKVSKQDEGKYTCVAQMGFIAVRCSVYLTVVNQMLNQMCESRWSSSSSLPTLPVTTHTPAVQTTSTDMDHMVPSSPPRTSEIPNSSSMHVVALVVLSTLVLVLVVVVVVLVFIVWRNRKGYRRSDNEGDIELNPVYQTTASLTTNPVYQTTASLTTNPVYQTTASLTTNPVYQTTASLTTNPAYQTTASFIPSTTNPAYAGPPVNIHLPHVYEDVFYCQK